MFFHASVASSHSLSAFSAATLTLNSSAACSSFAPLVVRALILATSCFVRLTRAEVILCFREISSRCTTIFRDVISTKWKCVIRSVASSCESTLLASSALRRFLSSATRGVADASSSASLLSMIALTTSAAIVACEAPVAAAAAPDPAAATGAGARAGADDPACCSGLGALCPDLARGSVAGPAPAAAAAGGGGTGAAAATAAAAGTVAEAAAAVGAGAGPAAAVGAGAVFPGNTGSDREQAECPFVIKLFSL
mmetsp:Transcript_1220/g.3663  ORF Transcript_1220/g.3663 Transcript_1220/m.3663 type:complete len:253 (+) Transcript_1220:365-1123(+)